MIPGNPLNGALLLLPSGEPVHLDRKVAVGRAPENDVVFDNPTVSRYHCIISPEKDALFVTDCNSSAGTIVNDEQRIEEPHALKDGDTIRIGDVELRIQWQSDELAAPPAERDTSEAEDLLDPVAGLSATEVEEESSPEPIVEATSVLVNQAEVVEPVLLSEEDPVQVETAEPVQVETAEPVVQDPVASSEEPLAASSEEPPAPAAAPLPSVETLNLRDIMPFSKLDAASFAALQAAGTRVTFNPHAVMMKPETRKKPKNGTLLVLLSGEAEVRGPIAGDWKNTVVVTRLSAGDYCGERALAYGHPYPHQVEATTKVEAFSVRQADFAKLTKSIPSLAGFFKDRVSRYGMVKYLREAPLFSQLNTDVLGELSDKVKLRSFPAGDILARKGEICRTFYLVASGSCRVDAIQSSQLVTLTHLTEGKFVGEQIAGQEEVYPYSLIADTPVDAYVVTRDEFLALAQKNPEALDFGAAELPPSVILSRTPPFSDLAPELVTAAARAFQVNYFRAGETIVQQDDPVADAFYIIAEGKVDVLFRNREGEERSLVQLKPGECFGEAALLTGSPRNATVNAIEDCTLLTLYRQDFTEILNRSPQQVGQFLASTHNARNRPKKIDNVEIVEERIGDKVGYILKNPNRNTYIKLSEQGLYVWELLDGEHTLTDIAAAYFQRYQTFAMGPMVETVSQLQRLGFIDSKLDSLMKLLSQRAKLTPIQRVMVAAYKALTFKIEFKNAHAIFSALYYGFCRIFFFKPVLLLIAIINIAGVFEFTRSLIGGTASLSFSAASVPLLVLITVIMTITHEMGHGITMIHVGRKVLGAGLGWNYIAPMAFVNTTDAWLATKGERLAVTAGGLIVTTTEAALCTLALIFVQDPGLRAALALAASLGWLTFLFNVNPMVPTDGYNFLVDLLRIQDLRPRALHYLFSGGVFRDLWKRTLGGEQRAFAVFGIFVALFMVYGGLSIALFISQFATEPLKAFLPVAAVTVIQIVLIALLFIFFILGLLREAKLGAQKAR